jgi:hypothetical protein
MYSLRQIHKKRTGPIVDCQKSIRSLEFDHKHETYQFGKTEKDKSSLFKERDGGFTLCQMEFNMRQKQ